MRHLNSGSKLGKQPDHRRAVLRSLVTNLLEHGRIHYDAHVAQKLRVPWRRR